MGGTISGIVAREIGKVALNRPSTIRDNRIMENEFASANIAKAITVPNWQIRRNGFRPYLSDNDEKIGAVIKPKKAFTARSNARSSGDASKRIMK